MEDLAISFVIGFIVFLVGWYMGFHYHRTNILSRMAEEPEVMIRVLQKIAEINKHIPNDVELGEDAVVVRAEHVNGMVYAYADDTNQFLGQGADEAAALEEAKKRFPGKSFWLNKVKQTNHTA
jgi:hypothetical protein